MAIRAPFLTKINCRTQVTITILYLLTSITLLSCRDPENKTPVTEQGVEKIRFVSFADVEVTDSLWSHKLEVNRQVTIPHNLEKSEEVGIIANFARAGGLEEGGYQGLPNWDEFLYKVVEAGSYALHTQYDPKLDSTLDKIIHKIASAQEEDGYLRTNLTLKLRSGSMQDVPAKWADLKGGLELYTAGHLFEAAIAHQQATGKDALMNVALKKANLIDSLFGPGKMMGVPGHEEIELALVRLYEATGEEKFLDLSEFFIDQRGNALGHELYGSFHQDHELFVNQEKAVGQAPRATYLYAAAADIAYHKSRKDYQIALDSLWQDVVYKKMYINGGIGSLHENEGFSEPYDLPNLTAYSEICAAISFPMWNARMFKLKPNSQYFDIIERTLYNNFMAGASLEGNSYFYACPLESDGEYEFNLGWMPKGAKISYMNPSATRKEWFPCACCPPNLARYYPQIPSYIYAYSGNQIFVNLFIQSRTTISLHDQKVQLTLSSRYPHDGNIKIEVNPAAENVFSLKIRIPAWALGKPAPGDLYRYLNPDQRQFEASVNNQSVDFKLDQGYLTLERKWKEGDIVTLRFPMNINRVVSHPKVKDNIGKVAFERGPVLYCFEGIDNKGKASEIVIVDDTPARFKFDRSLFNGTQVITVEGYSQFDKDRKTSIFTAIPYYLWSNRGVGKMAVWVNRPEGSI